jgi:hypothetical protein
LAAPVVAALVAGCGSRAETTESVTLENAASVFEEIHDRYVGKRFTHVTFVQRTQPAEGEVELWYEAIRPPGQVRVDEAPLEARRGLMYRTDSLYTFEDGAIDVAKGDERGSRC